MSKAILVIDMPEYCGECALCQGTSHDGHICAIEDEDYNERAFLDGDFSRPDWCPLKELPQRADHPNHCDGGRYDKGYNACIDEILEGK